MPGGACGGRTTRQAARTMPDSIAGMQALVKEQMAAAERLERNGIKMVLGRR